MSQIVEEKNEAVAAGGDPFAALLGKYARQDAGGNLVIVLAAEDLTNIGALMAQALFGYLLNKEVSAAPHAALAAAGGGLENQLRGS